MVIDTTLPGSEQSLALGQNVVYWKVSIFLTKPVESPVVTPFRGQTNKFKTIVLNSHRSNYLMSVDEGEIRRSTNLFGMFLQ